MTLELGRPLLANAVHKMHHHAVAKARGEYRDTACVLSAAWPHMDRVTISAQAVYPTARSLPDADAIAPSVKGVIDGLVARGVLDDDGPKSVRSVTYLAPIVDRERPWPALIVTVHEVPS